MSSLGDSGAMELISQLKGFLRDNTPRKPAEARITRVGLKAVNVALTQTGTKYTNIPMSQGVAGLAEGDLVYLLFLEGHQIVAVRTNAG